jgi:hypothetical protein
MGMIAVGVLGGAVLGALMDQRVDTNLAQQVPAIHSIVAGEKVQNYMMTYQNLNKEAVAKLPPAEQTKVTDIQAQTKQQTLNIVAILPGIMFLCYLALVIYFISKGGYRAQQLEMPTEKATGGLEAAVR